MTNPPEMFALAGQHSFVGDSNWCWLSVHADYAPDSFLWQLHLQSQDAPILISHRSEMTSFAISVTPPIGVRDWRDVPDCRIKVPEESLTCGFQFRRGESAQWEDLKALELRFGKVRETSIEIWVEGRGRVEAEPELFPDGEVSFQIHSWICFRGIGFNVPLNAGDPWEYAAARARALLPRYSFRTPEYRETADENGVVRAREILLPPS